MPLEEQKCLEIVGMMKAMSVQERLDGINKARELYPTFFTPEMSSADYAKAAMQLEQLYNLIREELRVSQIRIKVDTDPNASPVKIPKEKTPPKPKKENKFAKTMDIASLIDAFTKGTS